jgi:hypothetical protein
MPRLGIWCGRFRCLNNRWPIARHNLARAYQKAGELDRAIPLYERTLADCERVLGGDHSLTKTVHAHLKEARE